MDVFVLGLEICLKGFDEDRFTAPTGSVGMSANDAAELQCSQSGGLTKWSASTQ